MGINHRINQINIFGEMLRNVLFMKQQAEGSYMRIILDAQPVSIQNRRTFLYKEIPQMFVGNSEYEVYVKQHTHSVDIGNTGNHITGNTQNSSSQTGPITTTTTMPGSQRHVINQGTKALYTPRGIQVITESASRIPFTQRTYRNMANPQTDYYNELRLTVESLLNHQQEKKVLVLVNINTPNFGALGAPLGFIGNYTDCPTPPAILNHEHSHDIGLGSDVVLRWGSSKSNVADRISASTVPTTYALEDLPNKFLFPRGSIGFCKDVSVGTVEHAEIKRYIGEEIIRMEDDLKIYNTNASTEELLAQPWNTDTTHSETMFIAVAKELMESVRVLKLPPGTINDDPLSERDSKYVKTEKYAVLHVGQLNQVDTDYSEDGGYTLRHGSVRHTHRILRRPQAGGSRNVDNDSWEPFWGSGRVNQPLSDFSHGEEYQNMQLSVERRGLYVLGGVYYNGGEVNA